MSVDSLWDDRPSVIYRPSYSATWANCAGSLLPSQHAADNAGYDAAVGTVFHWLIAEQQENGRPDHWLNNVFQVEKKDENGEVVETFNVTCDQEMFDYADECLDRYSDIPGDRYVETFVDISSVTPIPKQGGTADLAICYSPKLHPLNRHIRRALQKLFPGRDFSKASLDIIDWKYGKGVQVFAEKNTQILLYAWGFFCLYDDKYHFETIRLHIAQPRFRHYDVYEITREELIEFSDWIRVRAREAWKRDAPKTVSPKACQWCRVKSCVALEAARQSMADLAFDVIEEPVTVARQKEIVALPQLPSRRLPPAIELTTEHLSQIARYSKLFENWFEEARLELISRAQNGEDVGPNWKLVEGRTKRSWRDEAKAASDLMSLGIDEGDIYQRKLVSPSKAEKLMRSVGVGGKLMLSFLKPLTAKPPGRPTLAPIGDNRLALENRADDAFEAEDEL